MKERPILFSGPMVNAILEGRKTQTRRVFKNPPSEHVYRFSKVVNGMSLWSVLGRMGHIEHDCPYGKPGDRLWVRETWKFLGTDMNRHGRTHTLQDGVVEYAADGIRQTIETWFQNVEDWMCRPKKSRPSIHMPRWASRITLEITNVRVERLQDISHEDARAEGMKMPTQAEGMHPYPLDSFRELWDKINGKKHPWSSNPWVWVVEFKRVDA